jgi:hypothetical protein
VSKVMNTKSVGSVKKDFGTWSHWICYLCRTGEHKEDKRLRWGKVLETGRRGTLKLILIQILRRKLTRSYCGWCPALAFHSLANWYVWCRCITGSNCTKPSLRGSYCAGGRHGVGGVGGIAAGSVSRRLAVPRCLMCRNTLQTEWRWRERHW